MKLTVLGISAGSAYQGRNYTAQFLQVENQHFMIDCGEATQHQAYKFKVKLDRVNQIFISHLHGDHVLGLPGLLNSFAMRKREAPLTIFSPPGLAEMIETIFRVSMARQVFPVEFQEVDATVAAQVFENAQIEVWSIPLRHRLPTCGWFFKKKEGLRHIRPEAIEAYGIDYQLIPGIKHGDDLRLPDGKIIPNAELTTPPTPSKSYAFCSDTAFHPPVAEFVRGVDLLYHEATFTEEHREEAEYSNHSTAADAARIARLAGAKCLLLGHLSSRYPDWTKHLAEARGIFPETSGAEEGGVYEIG